jgi:hypothetical protein
MNMIKNCQDIKGHITQRKNEIKLLSYADDNTVIITDPKSYKHVFTIYEEHAMATEAKINVDKTEILKIGFRKHFKLSADMEENVKTEVKVLGNLFTNDRDKLSQRNWEAIVTKIEQRLHMVKGGKVTIVGKVLLCNSLLLSQIWHRAWLLQNDKKYIKQIRRLLNEAITGSEAGKWVIDTISKPAASGGLGLIRIAERIMAIKVKQFEPIIKNEIHEEHDNLIYYFGTRAQVLIGRYNGPKKESNRNRYEKCIKFVYAHATNLKDMDKLEVKKLEKLIFPGRRSDFFLHENIYKIKDARLKGLAYKVATDLLPLPMPEVCPACGGPTRHKTHLSF